jgi:hypothetical protein
MKVVNPKVLREGVLKLTWIKYNSLLKRLLALILMLLHLKILDSNSFLAPSWKVLKKSTLGR